MIIPMYKYSFLAYHKDYLSFLNELREIGVVHIIEKNQEVSEEISSSLQLVSKINETVKFLDKRVEQKHPVKNTKKDGLELLNEIQDIKNELDKLKQKREAVKKQISDLEPWGNFSLETIEKLKENNIALHFYICPEKAFKDEWTKDYTVETINKFASDVYFVVITKQGEKPDIDADPVSPPSASLSQLQQQLQEIEKEIKKINTTLDEYAEKYIDLLNHTAALIQENTDFKQVVNNVEGRVDDKIMFVEGWVPSDREMELLQMLEKENVLFLKETAKNEDPKEVPVVLKNNRFARLFEVIGNLFSLPNAAELDLTPYFAPFFALFFGFCLGDAGYGLLFIIAATIFKPKVNKDIKPILSLLQVLGGATVFFGVLTGTFFGVELAKVEALGGIKDQFLGYDKLFNLSLQIGLVQIIFGMCLKAVNTIKQKGWLYAASIFGWILLAIASVLFFMVIPEELQNNYKVTYYAVIVISMIMILFLNDPKRNIFVNFGAGLWEVYSNATGLLGDILSYVRLFALGISSAILGLVFNDIALQTRPDIPVLGELVFLIIILFGHGINIFMATLAAFVHPMRLTFVEFYKNAGFAGGGKKYKPFTKLKGN
jgi:V/A-type H+/Na+-transporting ATPase subunit I